MDPFARKMLFACLGFGVTVLLTVATVSAIYFHNRPECSEAVYHEVKSPDGQWSAAVMGRRCGDESPFMIHINLRRATQPVRVAYFSGKIEQGEIFLAQEETDEADPVVEWRSSHQLTIRCPHCRGALVQKRQDRWGPVEVDYQIPP